MSHYLIHFDLKTILVLTLLGVAIITAGVAYALASLIDAVSWCRRRMARRAKRGSHGGPT